MKPLKNAMEYFLNLLYPPKCPFCEKVLDRPGTCPACDAAVPRTGAEHSLRKLDSGLLCAAPLWYEGMVRDALLRLKFNGRASSAVPLGAFAAECAAEHFSGEFDVVTWTPVSRKRLKKRGYDQAELLARSICRRWDTRPVRLLWKIKDNPAQSGLESAAQRRENVQGVYKAAPEARGKRILLVDDICTTGSTLTACAQTLFDAGAACVFCICVASAGKSVNFGKE